MADDDKGGKPLGAGRRRKRRRETSGAPMFMERERAAESGTRPLPPALQPLDRSGGATEVVHVEAFEPSDIRPWRFHNRTGSGMDDASLDALPVSIRRDGQQQLGLGRRLPPGDAYRVEAVFGVRRLEACRRERVRPAPAALLLPDRRQARIVLDPVRHGGAESLAAEDCGRSCRRRSM